MNRVLITGVAGTLGGRLAQRLEADDRVDWVAGLDLRQPTAALTRTEFIRADLRSPVAAKVIESTNVDTIVHLSIASSPGGVGGRARMKDLNVIGTMQLLAAARRMPALRKVVIKSTTAVYGSNYADPALFREESKAGATPRAGYAKDAVEIEGYARSFAHRRGDLDVTLLRFANFVGPGVDTPLTRYFALPILPTVLGYDPRLQLVHIDDAVEVLRLAALDHRQGVYNVAGPGILYLSQAIRRAGRPSVSVPLPFVNGIADMLRRSGRVDFSPEQLQFMLYGRVGDITRLHTELGYEPRYSTEAAFEDFLSVRGIQPLVDAATVAGWERTLRDRLARVLT